MKPLMKNHHGNGIIGTEVSTKFLGPGIVRTDLGATFDILLIMHCWDCVFFRSSWYIIMLINDEDAYVYKCLNDASYCVAVMGCL